MNNEYVSSVTSDLEPKSNGPRQVQVRVNQPTPELSIEWVMAKMEAIISDNEHISYSIKAISGMTPTGEHDHSTKGQAEAIAQVVKSREATNQQALKFLEKVYDDLKPSSPTPKPVLKDLDLVGLAEVMDSENVVEIVRAFTNVM